MSFWDRLSRELHSEWQAPPPTIQQTTPEPDDEPDQFVDMSDPMQARYPQTGSLVASTPNSNSGARHEVIGTNDFDLDRQQLRQLQADKLAGVYDETGVAATARARAGEIARGQQDHAWDTANQRSAPTRWA
jgi:hypothetical protein